MPISRSVTSGLAWAGLFVVVGVPAADFLLARMDSPSALVAQMPAGPVAEEVETVAAPEAAPDEVTAEAEAFDPVAAYLAAGRELPSYIVGQAGFAPAEVSTAGIAPEAVAPASFAPAPSSAPSGVDEKVAPVPMPLSMRPAPIEALFIPDTVLAQTSMLPVLSVSSDPERRVGPEELAGWQSGTLADFLAGQPQGSSADYDPGYDPRWVFPEGTQGGSSAVFRTEPAPVTGVWPLR